jgi:hypothetical protein
MSEILHFHSGSISLQSVEALTKALRELEELRTMRDVLQTENTRLVNENRRLKTGDVGEAYNAGEEKVTALLGQANGRVKDAYRRRDVLAGQIAEWDALRSWLMEYPADAGDVAINEAISTATPTTVVNAIKDGHNKLKLDLMEARAELAEYKHAAGVTEGV